MLFYSDRPRAAATPGRTFCGLASSAFHYPADTFSNASVAHPSEFFISPPPLKPVTSDFFSRLLQKIPFFTSTFANVGREAFRTTMSGHFNGQLRFVPRVRSCICLKTEVCMNFDKSLLKWSLGTLAISSLASVC